MQVQVRGWGARRWVTFGAIALGSVFTVLGVALAGMSISFLKDAERAKGTVVALEWRSDSSGTSRKNQGNDSPAAYPVVEYVSSDGIPRTFQSSMGSNPPSYDRGEQVEVLYRADAPEDARINGFVSLWLLPLIFGGIGLVIAGIGTAVAVAGRRRP
ncbi:DUF3592 domain-containing protein [Streptomyces sp. NPDC050439]|uniref:DUF3592 domain-containing protein n=1 Tax=unclassified Streptomyces TaxID=2593676 RepID=UPI003428D3CA